MLTNSFMPPLLFLIGQNNPACHLIPAFWFPVLFLHATFECMCPFLIIELNISRGPSSLK
jgi:hypothetical protein